MSVLINFSFNAILITIISFVIFTLLFKFSFSIMCEDDDCEGHWRMAILCGIVIALVCNTNVHYNKFEKKANLVIQDAQQTIQKAEKAVEEADKVKPQENYVCDKCEKPFVGNSENAFMKSDNTTKYYCNECLKQIEEK